MAQMTKALAEAILNGDGATRNEIEQLCHFFLSANSKPILETPMDSNVVDFTKKRLKNNPVQYTVIIRHDENGMSFVVNDVQDSKEDRLAVARDLNEAAKALYDDIK